MVPSEVWRQIQDEVNAAGRPRMLPAVDVKQPAGSAADASVVMVPSEEWREIQDELRAARPRGDTT